MPAPSSWRTKNKTMRKITKLFFAKNFPRRKEDSHKNLNGRVFIVAGSKNMAGAAILCAKACYLCGAGFVTVACVKEIADAVVCAVPQALVLRLPQDKEGCLNKKALKEILSYLKKYPHDLILTGCGLGGGAKITLPLLKEANVPAVIDADSLNFIAQAGAQKIKNISRKNRCVLTPHAGEMQRLLKTKKTDEKSALKLSALTAAVCLLKGPKTKVAFGGEIYENTTGNCGLAKAGSGDILSGIIAAIYARLLRCADKKSAEEKAFCAACLGVFLHGLCADRAVKKTGTDCLCAEDIFYQIPLFLKNFSAQKL